MKNRYTEPYHKGISTARQRRKPKVHSRRRKYLREPQVRLDTGWLMDYDVQNMYLGGWNWGNAMIWGSAGSGKSNLMMHFLKSREEPKKDFESPFK